MTPRRFDLDNSLYFLQRLVGHVRIRGDARIINPCINAAKMAHRLVGQMFDLGGVRDVGDNDQRLGVQIAYFVGDGV